MTGVRHLEGLCWNKARNIITRHNNNNIVGISEFELDPAVVVLLAITAALVRIFYKLYDIQGPFFVSWQRVGS